MKVLLINNVYLRPALLKFDGQDGIDRKLGVNLGDICCLLLGQK